MTERYRLGKLNPFVRWIPWLVLSLAMLSSLVKIEPAPVDGLTIAAAVFLFATGLRIPRGFLLPLLFLFVFLLGNVVSVYFAQQTAAAFIYFAVTAYLVLALILYVGLMYWDYQRLLRYFWIGYALAAFVAVSAGIIGFFQLIPQADMFTLFGRASGTFKDPNVYGPYLVPIILYLLNILDDERGLAKVLYGGLAIFLMFGLFLSFSRGAILYFVIALLVMLGLKLRSNGSMQMFRRYFVVGTALTGLLIAALAISVGMTERLQSMFEDRAKVVQEYDVEEGGRFNTQRIALENAMQHPWGIGPGDSDLLMGLEPHNVYLLVLVENGVIGFIGWVGFFGLTVISATRLLRHSLLLPRDFLPVYAAVVGILLESFIIDSIHWRILFVLSGVLWGMMLAVRCQETEWLHKVSSGLGVKQTVAGSPAVSAR